jgi:hypothetical protein
MTKARRAKRLSFAMDLPSDLTPLLREKIEALPASVRTDYLKSEIFSKFVSSETDPADVRRTRAINKWLSSERDNEATNDRLLLTPEDYNILPRVPFGRFVEVCSNIVRDIIGDTPPTHALIGMFSGGASTSRPRTSSHPATKYVGKAHVTLRCLDVFLSLVEEMPGWINAQNSLSIEIVPGNVMFTVPKKADIDRVCCKEPDLNMFIQKGIGSYFRRCLRRTGINLNDQSINRSLAREGSITRKLATLDLSSASDSVTSGLTALLLPEVWYTLLDSVRSPVTVIDGEEHQNHMFSSMGNGFTFELESLLFYAISRTVAYFTRTRGIISVYGDDIICPTEMTEDLIWVLDYLGFQTNVEKSHFSGSFRESCGGHYDNGIDVTPFYVKEPIVTMTDLIDVANKLRKWSDYYAGGILCPETEELWFWLKQRVPSYLWGGCDYTFKYQLVSHDTPSKRIQEETDRLATGDGGYYHWLNTTWARTEPTDGVSTSVLTKPVSKFRLRPVRDLTVPRLPAVFWKEYCVTSEL